jgi:tetratricopeptide (TPR) repeat protein
MRAVCAVLVFAAIAAPAFPQTVPEVSVSLAPGASLPLGDNSSYFSFGAGAEITAGLEKVLPAVTPRLALGYDWVPLRSLGFVNLFRAGAGLSMPFQIMPGLRLSPYLLGGYTYGTISDGSGQGGGPFVKAGCELAWLLGPLASLGLDVSYRWDIGAWGGLALSLHSGVHFPIARPQAAPAPRAIKGLEMQSPELAPAFPALFKLYDTKPLGTVKLRSLEKTPMSDLTVDFFVASYMDNPTRVLSLANLDGGATVDIPLKALFSEQVLKITEATKVSGKVSVSFVLDGQPYTREFALTLPLNNRNNITWDDTRKAAAFVTPNDPLVLTLAKSAVAVTSDVPSGQIDQWLLAAMAMHDALRAKGQRYSVDPNTPFDQISKNHTQLDTVYFPQETLAYGAGDCDDLTVLYTALLQSVGAQTAFITVPGHIFAAVKLDVAPDRAGRFFSRLQDLIVRDGVVWLPVEVTMCGSGFLDAWQTAAQEWRQYDPQGLADFLPVSESWKVYEPVGQIPAIATTVKMPDQAAVSVAYRAELSRFVDQQIQPKMTVLQNDISARKNDPKPVNSLGVLYAQYGRMDLAAAQFDKASRMGEYVPALINLAGVRFLSRDYPAALALYTRANTKDSTNANALLGLARTNAALERFDDARAQFAALQKVNPDLAAQYSYLGGQGTTTARGVSLDAASGRMVWDEGAQQ